MKKNTWKYVLVALLGAAVTGATLLISGTVSRDPHKESPPPETAVSEEEREESLSTEREVWTVVSETPEDSQEVTEEPESTLEETGDEPAAETGESIVLRAPEAVINTSTTLYTYDMMQDDLRYLAAAYPHLVSLRSAGTTEDGRDLSYVVFGNPNAPRQIYICAATHAREYMTTQLVMRQLAFYCTEYETGSYNGRSFRDIFENTCFYVEPMVNPDGVTISQFGEAGLRREDLRVNLQSIFRSDLAGGFAETSDYAAYLVRWKANAVGVDINRNYSPGWETVAERPVPSSTFFKGAAPGSERETKAQMAIIESMTNPLAAISYHSYGDLVYWQYGQPEPLWSENQALAQHISNMTGQYLAGYSNEAGFSNWCVIEKHIKSVTVETGTVPAPLPLSQFAELWEEHRYMWAMLATVY